MFQTDLRKRERNPLRRALYDKGYSLRSAAKALGLRPPALHYYLEAHDPVSGIAPRIAALPALNPETALTNEPQN